MRLVFSFDSTVELVDTRRLSLDARLGQERNRIWMPPCLSIPRPGKNTSNCIPTSRLAQPSSTALKEILHSSCVPDVLRQTVTAEQLVVDQCSLPLTIKTRFLTFLVYFLFA